MVALYITVYITRRAGSFFTHFTLDIGRIVYRNMTIFVTTLPSIYIYLSILYRMKSSLLDGHQDKLWP